MYPNLYIVYLALITGCFIILEILINKLLILTLLFDIYLYCLKVIYLWTYLWTYRIYTLSTRPW